MTRETKVGLLMMAMLIGVFSVLAFKKLHSPSEAMAVNGENDSGTSGVSSTDEPGTRAPSLATATENGDPFQRPIRSTGKVVSKTLAMRNDTSGETRSGSTATNRNTLGKAENDNLFDEPSSSIQRSPASTARVTTISARSRTSENPFDEPEPTTVAARSKVEVITNLDDEVPATRPTTKSSVEIDDLTEDVSTSTTRTASVRPSITVSPRLELVEDQSEALVIPAPSKGTPREIAAVTEGDAGDAIIPLPEPAVESGLQSGKNSSDPFFEDKPASLPVPAQQVPLNVGPTARGLSFDDDVPPARTTPSPAKSLQAIQPRPAPATQMTDDFSPQSPARELVPGDTYTVEPNENFWAISRKKYGTGRYFLALAEHNRNLIPDPKSMKPGVTIDTPAAAVLEQRYAKLIPKAAVNPQPAPTGANALVATSDLQVGFSGEGPTPRQAVRAAQPGNGFYVVQDGDNYWTISRQVYGAGRYFQALAQHNQARVTNPNQMTLGTEIETPPASVLEEKYSKLIPRAAVSSPVSNPSTSGVRMASVNQQAGFVETDVAPRQSARTGQQPNGRYIIQEGDSYWSISREVYGAGRYFQALAQHNIGQVPNPNQMTLGVQIDTPAAEELERLYPKLVPKGGSAATTASPAFAPVGKPASSAKVSESGYFTAADGTPMHQVGDGDTLTDIAQRYLGRSTRWVQILELNRDILKDGNALTVGTNLKLPADAIRVGVVEKSR